MVTDILSLVNKLNNVHGYLACEKIVIQYVLQCSNDGADESFIENKIDALAQQLRQSKDRTQNNEHRINYSFALGFAELIRRHPGWKDWITKL